MDSHFLIYIFLAALSKASDINDIEDDFIGYASAFRTADNLVMSQFNQFEGILDLFSCINICGCKGNGVAAFDNETSSCFCGENPQLNCVQSYCIKVYNSSGYTVSVTSQLPTTVYVNTPFDVVTSASKNVKTIGLVVNDRLATYSSNLLSSIIVGMPGNYVMSVESNALYGCPSTIHDFTAQVKKIACTYYTFTLVKLEENATFNMFVDLIGPDNVAPLKIMLFEGNDELPFMDFNYPNPSASTYVEIGGNSETNRYQTYNLTFSENKRTAVIVSLNHQISSSGVVTGFSAYVTKLGGIRFLILEPSCEKTTSDSKRKMCFYSKKCVLTSDSCPLYSNTFYPSAKTDIFYPDLIQFGPSGATQPTWLTTRTTADVMFRLVYSFAVNATVLGHNDFVVPDSEQFTTVPGQFLAWMPDHSNNTPGDVAFNSISSTNQFQAIHYNEIFDVYINESFDDNPAYESPIEVSNTEHMISLYLEIPSKYVIEIAADYPDGTDIISKASILDTLGNEINYCEGKTTVVSEIQNLIVTTMSTTVVTDSVIDFNVSAISGISKASHAVYWGENENFEGVYDEIFNESVFQHTFSKPGLYNIYVKSFNEINFQVASLSLWVVCALGVPSFFNTNEDATRACETINPVKTTDEEISVDVAFTGCGVVSVSYFLESDILQINGNSSLKLSESSIFVIKSSEFQTQAQPVNVTVCATNNIEVQCISNVSYVEDVIENFNLISVTLETNVSGFINVSSMTKGTNKTYCIEWGDGSKTCTNGTYDVEAIEHTYNRQGNYTVFALAFNRVSQMNLTIQQKVLDRISGCKISAQSTIYNTPTEVFFSIKSGTGIFLALDWDDKKTRNVIYDFDISFNDSLNNSFVGFRGFASFTFSVKQDYNICLSLSNDISNDLCCVVAIVEDKIRDFNIKLVQEFKGTNKSDWIEENETLLLISDHNIGAERILYLVDLGNEIVFNTTSPVVNVSYTPWKLCYNYSVVATNPVSIASDWMNLCVQRPLYPINSTGFVHAPENSTEEMSIKFTFSAGNYFDCYFNFNDKSSKSLFPVSYTDFVGPIDFIEAKHKFKAGKYNVTLSCTNRLYDFFSSTIVLSQDPVVKPYLNITARCSMNNSVIKVMDLVKSSPEIMSDACNIFVITQDQSGSNVNESGILKIEGVERDFSCLKNNTVEFKTQQWSYQSVYDAEVCISSVNKVSADVTCKFLQLIKPFTALKVTVDGIKHSVGVPITFKVEFPYPLPGYPCLEIDFQDNTPSQVFGNSICIDAQKTLTIPFSVTYTFKKSSKYRVNFKGSNQVSSITETILVDVLDAPCSPPTIEFTSSAAYSEDSLNIFKNAYIYKCKKTIFSYVMRKNCSRNNSTLIKKINIEFKVNANTWLKVLKEKPLGERYILEANSLKEYGIYRVTYIGYMFDEVSKQQINETLAQKTGYFMIVPCPLKIIVDGGYEKTFQRGGDVVIDASRSFDPDQSLTDFKVEWFCGRSDEFNGLDIDSLPKLYYPVEDTSTYPNKTFPPNGCFRNSGSPGKLSDKGMTSLKLVLNSDYLWYYCYDLRLRISLNESFLRESIKDVRLCITPNDTLHVTTKCELNCDDLVNPNSKLSISSLVLNKNLCGPESVINYKWLIFRKLKASLNSTYANVSNELINNVTTGLTKRNFVLKAKSLDPAYRYKFHVEASCNEEKTYGTGAEVVDVNYPPDVSKVTCEISPKIGIAWSTDFVITCNDAEDDQKPLFYGFEYKCKNDIWAPLTISTSVSNVTSGQVKLPPGNEKTGNCSIQVRVRDSYGVQSDPIPTRLEAKVSPEKKTEQRKKRSIEESVLKMCDNISSDDVLSSESMKANYLVALLEMSSLISRSCKSKIEKLLLSIWVDTPENANLVLHNIQPDGNHSIALATIKNVANTIQMMAPDEFSTMSLQILKKTSSLIGGDDASQMMAAVLKLEAEINSMFIKSLIPGEPAAQTQTLFGNISFQQIEAGTENIGGFTLPNINGIDGGAINTIGKNRYTFDKASSSVKSKVKGLSLTDQDGSPKAIQNLTKPITLVLENEEVALPPKNFSAYCELMRDIHRVDATVNSSIIVLNARAMNDSFTGFFFLFMNKGTAPSLADNQQNCTLPNPNPSNWDSLTKDQQEYWTAEKKWTCYFSEEKLNKTAVGVWCVGVIYYTDVHPLTKTLLPLSAVPSDDNCTAVKYTFQAYTRACLYWDQEINTWNTEGCLVVEKDTDSSQTVCACTHLTDFGGGGPFANAAPVELGALKAFPLKSNPTVFSVVMSLFGLYILMFVWARKKDLKDVEKGKVILLPDNHPDDQYFYEIVVETGFKSGCSTTADVVIMITGSKGESGPRRLYCSNKKCFQRGQIDVFIMAVPAYIGELTEVSVWHNNSGASPGWFLLKIQVCDMQTQEQVDFLCNQWLDVAEGDGKIVRKLYSSSYEDMTDFKYLFFVTVRRNLYEGHIWLSLFTRPAQSSFTTCQRLATCMSLLLTSMIVNAMFYKGDTGIPAATVTMGLFTFSINEIKNALTVALIVFPGNLLIILLFKKAGPKISKNANKYETVKVLANLPPELMKIKKRNARIQFLRSLFFPGGEDNKSEELLPHWLIYIAYLIAFLSSAVSAFFVIAYGFDFGKKKSDQWVVTMLFSFCFSVFLIQPIKVVILSVLFSTLIKSTGTSANKESTETSSKKKLKSETHKEEEEEGEEEEINKVISKDLSLFRLPEERKLQEYRVARMKEKRIKIIIKEVLVHLSFVVLVIVVAYSSADPYCYQLYYSALDLCALNGINKDFYAGKAYLSVDGLDTKIPTGYDVALTEDWFNWAKYSVVDYLFPDGWYDDKKTSFPFGYIGDSASSKVLAMARFRQVRVKPNSCTKHPVFKYLINECNAGYSWFSEEDQEFKAGWLPPYNETEKKRRRRGKRKAAWKGFEDPWVYQSTTELKNPFPFTGFFNTYTGSSYAVSIGPDRNIAKRILQGLKKNFWIDRYTRALFTEINIYNANTNLMLIVTFLHEILPTGGWNFYTNIQALRLYRYVGGLGDLVIVFDLVFSAISLIGVYKSVRAARRSGLKVYLSNPWNLLHVVVTVNSICAIAFTLGRMMAVKMAVAEYTLEPEMFVSFQFVGQLEYLIIGCLGFVLFFTNLEFLRILRFNQLISLLSKSISLMSGPLLSFGMIFIVVFMAFVSFTTCIYVNKLEDFQSIPRSFVTMTTMFLGKISVSDYFDNAPVFGPLMFASYMLSIQMIMINLFVGLICDAFNEVGKLEILEEEPGIFGFMVNQVKSINSERGLPDPIYAEWQDEWEQLMEGLQNLCDNCIYIMRNMEAEEIRQRKFFDQENKVKTDLLVAVIGLDFFSTEAEFCDGLTSLEKKLMNMTIDDAKRFLIQAAVKRRSEQFQQRQEIFYF